MSIYLTAILKSNKESIQDLKSILDNMVLNTRKEEACEKYELQHSLDDETVFIFHEIWKSKEGLDAHNQQPYIQEFVEKVPDLLENPAEIYLAKLV
ncbi:putative quinol monooxygenase [Epilithonimonas hispanica]|uniref:Antibiotic biosynthesis monooxygenase n=1 Tax=Epilithonimonas hispanica TaxID=358687 RepID=A0A3D9CJZ1_9FLAO|nr:putative quinol monooxygenase [Epilithonimonas hispanica]REC66040.1 antibiotic biosynthesis monooxygenase [Epilithonimonas hispanica]